MALPCLKGGTECGNNWVKTRIYSAPAVKGLTKLDVCGYSEGLSHQTLWIITMETEPPP